VRRTLVVTGLLLLSAILVATFGLLAARRQVPTGGAAQAQEISVRSREFGFEPGQLRLRAGVPVRLTLDNSAGELVHDFTVETVGGQGLVARLIGPGVQLVAPPGSRAAVEFTPAEGAYLFFCSVYRHRLDGMTGVLIVD
jgi:plastocyanin